MKFFIEEICAPLFIIVGGVAVLLAVVFFFLAQIAFVVKTAEFDQLRHDAKLVDAKMAEDVAGQVASANQFIARMKRLNDSFVGPIIPNGWDSFELIEMPKTP